MTTRTPKRKAATLDDITPVDGAVSHASAVDAPGVWRHIEPFVSMIGDISGYTRAIVVHHHPAMTTSVGTMLKDEEEWIPREIERIACKKLKLAPDRWLREYFDHVPRAVMDNRSWVVDPAECDRICGLIMSMFYDWIDGPDPGEAASRVIESPLLAMFVQKLDERDETRNCVSGTEHLMELERRMIDLLCELHRATNATWSLPPLQQLRVNIVQTASATETHRAILDIQPGTVLQCMHEEDFYIRVLGPRMTVFPGQKPSTDLVCVLRKPISSMITDYVLKQYHVNTKKLLPEDMRRPITKFGTTSELMRVLRARDQGPRRSIEYWAAELMSARLTPYVRRKNARVTDSDSVYLVDVLMLQVAVHQMRGAEVLACEAVENFMLELCESPNPQQFLDQVCCFYSIFDKMAVHTVPRDDLMQILEHIKRTDKKIENLRQEIQEVRQDNKKLVAQVTAVGIQLEALGVKVEDVGIQLEAVGVKVEDVGIQSRIEGQETRSVVEAESQAMQKVVITQRVALETLVSKACATKKARRTNEVVEGLCANADVARLFVRGDAKCRLTNQQIQQAMATIGYAVPPATVMTKTLKAMGGTLGTWRHQGKMVRGIVGIKIAESEIRQYPNQ